jgi:hypothetical protein
MNGVECEEILEGRFASENIKISIEIFIFRGSAGCQMGGQWHRTRRKYIIVREG